RVTGRKGEYTRTMSSVIDAYLHDQMYHGLASLEVELRRNGYTKPMLLVHNTRGMAQPNSTPALQTIHSRPAAGVEATTYLSATSPGRPATAAAVDSRPPRTPTSCWATSTRTTTPAAPSSSTCAGRNARSRSTSASPPG